MNPVLVEVLRGSLIESRHRGAVVVCDSSGKVAFSQGDIDARIYPRSAVKAIQALPLIESGAADRFGLDSNELALACSSHSGEPQHVATAAAMLAKAGRDVGTLECGVQWALPPAVARALAARGEPPSALHNNCSGKHAGFICLSCSLGVDSLHYVQPDHIAQREVTAALAAVPALRSKERRRPSTAARSRPIRSRFRRSLAALRGSARATGRARTRQGCGETTASGRSPSISGRGHGAFRYFGDGSAWGARLREDRRGRRLLCRPAGAGPRHCHQMRGRRQPRGRGGDGQCAVALHPMSDEEREKLSPQSAPRLRNWNGIEIGSIRVTEALGESEQ